MAHGKKPPIKRLNTGTHVIVDPDIRKQHYRKLLWYVYVNLNGIRCVEGG